jgi:hypothetical protein
MEWAALCADSAVAGRPGVLTAGTQEGVLEYSRRADGTKRGILEYSRRADRVPAEGRKRGTTVLTAGRGGACGRKEEGVLKYSRRADGRAALGAAAAHVAGRRPSQVPGLGAEAGAALAAHAGVDKISFTGSGVRLSAVCRLRRLGRGSPWFTPKPADGCWVRLSRRTPSRDGRRLLSTVRRWPLARLSRVNGRHLPSASAVGIRRVRQPTSRKIMAAAAMGPRAISLELGGKVRQVRA